MYNKFFGLAEAPFNITPDSRFLFLSQRHREALSALLYGIKERKGFILLTGEIGAGKTTICRALVHELQQDDVKLALILNPGLSELELLKAINDEFRIPSFYDTKKGLIDALNRFLIAENQSGNNVVLIIDEAQNLEPTLLEQIRILSNLETESDKLLQIILMGQPELNETMKLSQLEQLNQRIAVRFHITPLTEGEMLAYIKHRLTVARAKIDVEFTDGALKLAYQATRGIPRKINVLCDRTLLACYVEGTYTVSERIMQAAIEEVSGDEPSTPNRKSRTAGLTLMAGGVPWRTLALYGIGALAVCLLVATSVAVGVKIANVNAVEGPPARVKPRDAEQAKVASDKPDRKLDKKTTATAVAKAESTAKAAPTPRPDWEQIRKRNPNWQYERNVPLVRVNNPRVVKRAAQLSLLKMWGLTVDLGEMAKLGEDLITNGSLKSDKLKIHEFQLPGEYSEIVRLNVPVMVKLDDPSVDQSEYVVLLKSEGETATVGDPQWGVKIYQTRDLVKKWAGATGLFVDSNGLGSIQKGERNDRVRALQQFLKDQNYLDEVTGVFDVKTSEAIVKLQSYYDLKNTSGHLDEVTVMILNSRMMREGPRLTETE